MARKPRKPLFAGLSIDLPTGPQMYAARFKAEQSAKDNATLLKTPPIPPSRRPLPGGRADNQARIADLTTRSRKGVVPSVGTPNVPAGLRRTATEQVRPKSADGRRKGRAASASRDKSAEKIVYNSRVGMTARRALTRDDTARAKNALAVETVAAFRARGEARTERASSARKRAQTSLSDAIARERNALARGDVQAAESARADIRKFRKSARYQGE
ncbi:hypothetical protein [Streptomyces sp. CBMA29]|uniref:hypothetical protein n=1 Tax=Streptomyces sp. CBMA29 TaxID=1896314 RepID=UPI001661B641|nr:hypothetical protein [Streptomyces sp. CBMA29]